jgi:hypothetical protein
LCQELLVLDSLLPTLFLFVPLLQLCFCLQPGQALAVVIAQGDQDTTKQQGKRSSQGWWIRMMTSATRMATRIHMTKRTAKR